MKYRLKPGLTVNSRARNNLSTAKQIMSNDPQTLLSTADPEEVLKMFIEKHFTSMPVLSPGGNVLGLLTELVLVKVVMQCRQTKKGEKLANFQSSLIPPQFVNKDASLAEVIKAMMQSPTHRVLVQESTGRFIGVISPKDILKMLAVPGMAA